MSAVYGLLAQGLILAAVLRLLMRDPPQMFQMIPSKGPSETLEGVGGTAPRPPAGGVGMAMAIVVITLIVPVGEVSLAAHMRGIWGDPSVPSFALLALAAFAPHALPTRPRRAIAFVLALGALLFLYGPILVARPGCGWDAYPLGWSPLPILAVLGVAAWRFQPAATWMVILAAAVAAHAGGLMESSNLWDYLVDPGLCVGLFAVSLSRAAAASSAVPTT